MKRMSKPNKEIIHLAKSVDTKSVLLLGIGALLGGGIFTLIGPSIAFAGAAVLIAIGINAFVSFLNLQTYVSFATTIPEAGGGNRWVKQGLGDFQGFIAGWISWLAHGSACGLYALSGAFYLNQLFFSILNIPLPSFLSHGIAEKGGAILFLVIFGWLNWKSNKTTQRTGEFIVIILLCILGLFIISGFTAFFGLIDMNTLSKNILNNPFDNFFEYGLIGIMSAAALFYIAFEGSEIQAQSGEEIKNPKNLKTALFGAWGTVSILYFLIAFIMVANGSQGELGGGAIIKSAQLFMPFGVILMTLGGILANLAALNATIFSSSRLAFSLARDRSILHHLSHIHLKNMTPNWAVLASVILIGIMVLILPLVSVGASASLLFILLFLQLNIAAIAMRRQNPDIQWNYTIIGYPFTTVLAIITYIILGIAMAFIISAAWLVAIIWILLGIINYFAYTKHQRRESFEKEIMYQKTLRLGVKKTYRILLPVDDDATSEDIAKISRFAFAIASYYEAEIIAVTIVPTNAENPLHARHMIDTIGELAEAHTAQQKDKRIDTHTYVLASNDVVETLLEIIREEHCDILILSWDGYVNSKGKIFGSKIDPVLRKAACDLLVFKTNGSKEPRSILFAADFRFRSPFVRFTGKIASALARAFKSHITIFTVIPPSFKKSGEYDTWRHTLDFKIKKRIKLDPDIRYDIVTEESASIASAIIEKSSSYDLIIMGASREQLFKEIRIGNIPESIAKHIKKPVMIVKGHRGITQPFIDYLKDWIGI